MPAMKATSERLAHFRQKHPPLRRTIAGRTWSLVVAGSGSRVVLVLPGAGSTGDFGAELMFPVVAALEKRLRVVSVGYPADATRVDDIIEGIRGILEEENMRTVAILGHSLGALFGKCFTQKYPEKVESLVLANFADPSPSRARLFKILLSIMIIVPQSLSIKIVKSQLRRLLKEFPDRFWLSYLTSPEADTSLKYIRNQYRCMLDFVRYWPAKPWLGPVLILESDNERIGAPERRALRTLYPNSRAHVFREAGHLSWITHEQEFNLTVEDFLVRGQSA
jgi:pimeloyl-ACP methyl ester carboxylesterase